MKVEINEAKLKSIELALQNSEPCTVEKLIRRSEEIYKYIFGTEDFQASESAPRISAVTFKRRKMAHE